MTDHNIVSVPYDSCMFFFSPEISLESQQVRLALLWRGPWPWSNLFASFSISTTVCNKCFQQTTQQNLTNQYIPIPCLRTRNMDPQDTQNEGLPPWQARPTRTNLEPAMPFPMYMAGLRSERVGPVRRHGGQSQRNTKWLVGYTCDA